MISLDEKFIKELGISTYKLLPRSGQKYVFIIERDNTKSVLKLTNFSDERVNREIEILKKGYRGIPKVYEEGEYNGNYYYIEEFIDGGDLSEKQESFFSEPKLIKSLLLNIIDILNPIWNENHVHRDLKPSNIMFGTNEEVYVIDFGIARNLDDKSLTITGSMPKTISFCAPEQMFGDKDLITYRTDFFNLGLIAYYLYFKGKLPFSDTNQEIINLFESARSTRSLSVNNIDLVKDIQLHDFIKNSLKFTTTQRPNKINILRNYLI